MPRCSRVGLAGRPVRVDPQAPYRPQNARGTETPLIVAVMLATHRPPAGVGVVTQRTRPSTQGRLPQRRAPPHAPVEGSTGRRKGTDLSVHTEADLDWVADELNDRPRKRLQFRKPIEGIGPLLLR